MTAFRAGPVASCCVIMQMQRTAIMADPETLPGCGRSHATKVRSLADVIREALAQRARQQAGRLQFLGVGASDTGTGPTARESSELHLEPAPLALIVDTGPPFVAMDRCDPDHRVCREPLETAREPLVVSVPVLVEVEWLATSRPAGVRPGPGGRGGRRPHRPGAGSRGLGRGAGAVPDPCRPAARPRRCQRHRDRGAPGGANDRVRRSAALLDQSARAMSRHSRWSLTEPGGWAAGAPRETFLNGSAHLRRRSL